LKVNGTNIYAFTKSGTFEVTRRRSQFFKAVTFNDVTIHASVKESKDEPYSFC
jgi:hypothetical protein